MIGNLSSSSCHFALRPRSHGSRLCKAFHCVLRDYIRNNEAVDDDSNEDEKYSLEDIFFFAVFFPLIFRYLDEAALSLFAAYANTFRCLQVCLHSEDNSTSFIKKNIHHERVYKDA